MSYEFIGEDEAWERPGRSLSREEFIPARRDRNRDRTTLSSWQRQSPDWRVEGSQSGDWRSQVRRLLVSRGIVPESLPPAEDVKKVERRLVSEHKKLLGNVEGLKGPAESAD